MKKVAVIMAGGSGERFWPMSRVKKPKQVLNLASPNQSMIQESIDRINKFIKPEDIFIITSEILLESLRENLPDLPPQNIIAEPAKRNTSACLALAAGFIEAKYSGMFNDVVIGVLTADHTINPKESFVNTIETAMNFAYNNHCIVTIGIKPSRIETGYGYIEYDFDNVKENKIFKAKQFHEKPSFSKAEEYFEKGNFLWNSGMFFWKLDFFKHSLNKHLPEIGSMIDIMRDSYIARTDEVFLASNSAIKELFSSFPDISIDYGLMEKSDEVYVIESDFSWDDLGSWDSLDRVRTADLHGNIIEGEATIIESKDCIIINGSSRKFIVSGVNLDNMVIVVTDDAVMVSPKNKVQDVKKIVNFLKAENKIHYL
jgi:mannose-1-phosphate guanylyltransferase